MTGRTGPSGDILSVLAEGDADYPADCMHNYGGWCCRLCVDAYVVDARQTALAACYRLCFSDSGHARHGQDVAGDIARLMYCPDWEFTRG